LDWRASCFINRGILRVTDLLRAVDLFAGLSGADLERLSHSVLERLLRRDELLCRTDGPCTALYIVANGSLELQVDGQTRHIGVGETIGEACVISGEPLRGSVRAREETRVMELGKDEFDAVVAAQPQVMRVVLAAISRRAVQTNQRLLSEQPTEQRVSGSKIYSVFSPRGGAGKTLLATRLATRLTEQAPQRVALVDLDLLFDDAALELDVNVPASLGSAAAGGNEPIDARTVTGLLNDHPSGLRVLVGATTPEEGERVTAADVRVAMNALKQQFLLTVVDCGGTFSEPTLAALEQSDRVLVVCTPELLSLRDARDCQRIFGHALHLDKSRVAFVLNHPSPAAGITRRQFEEALEQRMLLEIPHAGERAAKSAFAKAIDQLARELTPAPARA
jgi:MinD-like ATPase involved in chromosome partitioning or flagellar assembly